MLPLNCTNDPSYMYDPQLKKFKGSLFVSSWVFPTPLYLATINNLSEPVYKTDSQTMKVIYTLTRQQS